MTTIASASDIHGQWKRPTYPPADVLIFAGDIFQNYDRDREKDADQQLVELEEFARHLAVQDYDEIIVVAGNHDFVFERRAPQARKILEDSKIHYLKDQSLVLNGIKYYGSPYTPFFHSWAFNFPPMTKDGGNDFRANAAAKECWKLIPDDTDVLITHGPPQGILDECPDGRRVGCPWLRKRLDSLNLKLHVFGHIHISAGYDTLYATKFKNTALLGEDYQTMAEITVETI